MAIKPLFDVQACLETIAKRENMTPEDVRKDLTVDGVLCLRSLCHHARIDRESLIEPPSPSKLGIVPSAPTEEKRGVGRPVGSRNKPKPTATPTATPTELPKTFDVAPIVRTGVLTMDDGTEYPMSFGFKTGTTKSGANAGRNWVCWTHYGANEAVYGMGEKMKVDASFFRYVS